MKIIYIVLLNMILDARRTTGRPTANQQQFTSFDNNYLAANRKVQCSPFFQSMNNNTNFIGAHVGDDVTLLCGSSRLPYNPNKFLIESAFQVIEENMCAIKDDFASLTISHVSKNDTGIYTCFTTINGTDVYQYKYVLTVEATMGPRQHLFFAPRSEIRVDVGVPATPTEDLHANCWTFGKFCWFLLKLVLFGSGTCIPIYVLYRYGIKFCLNSNNLTIQRMGRITQDALDYMRPGGYGRMDEEAGAGAAGGEN